MKLNILKKLALSVAMATSLVSCGVHVEASKTFTIGTEHLEEGSVVVYIEYAQLLIGESNHDMDQVFKATSILEDLLFASDVRPFIMKRDVRSHLQNSMDSVADRNLSQAYRDLSYALNEYENYSGVLYTDKESVLAYVEIILTELKLNNIDIAIEMADILDAHSQESHDFYGISSYAEGQIYEGMEQMARRNYAEARELFRSAQYDLERSN